MEEKKSRFEKQEEKIQKSMKKLWRNIAVISVIFYVLGVGIGVIMNFPRLYVARTLLVGIVLVVLGIIAGMYMYRELNNQLLPPPSERETPEIRERIKEDEE